MHRGGDSFAAASLGTWVLALAGLLFVTHPARGQLIGTVDYSDTFTVAEQGGVPERTDGSYNTGSPAYDVEDSHGNPLSTWTPADQFSFNTGGGSACCGYPTNNGNAGSATGLAQSGGTDFSFAYGLRTSYVVEVDNILPFDRLDISSLPAPGASIFSANSLSVFFRLDSTGRGIGIFNGAVETVVSPASGVNDGNWHKLAVHFDQDNARVRMFVDGTIVAAADLSTFAGGIYQNYSNAAVGTGGAGYDFVNRVLWVDNFQVGEPAPTPTQACFAVSTASGPPPLAVDFDAACSIFANGPQSYDWTFGDGGIASGPTASHTYNTGGHYQVTLTVKDTGGAMHAASKTITVYDRVSSFSDDFARPDGLVDGWTVFSVPGTWNIASGELVTGPTNEERWIWAGDPAIILPNRIVIEFDMLYLAPGTNAVVGRHGGAAFCASKPTHRGDGSWTGYFVDWIDRTGDRGLRLTRIDPGLVNVALLHGAPGSPADPPLTWRVEITGQNIRVFGDGTLYIDVVDNTYRGGHAGLWTWAGGQEPAYDNFSAVVPSNPLTACFTTTGPELPVAGTSVGFDASCTENAGVGTITAHEWAFGDGANDAGQVVSHSYAAPGRYDVTLTVRDSLGNESTSTRTITVFQSALNYSDNFDRPDGPIDGWTVYSVPGTWNILNGELVTGPTSEERFIWAGDTPVVMTRNAVYEWDQIFIAPGTNGEVGRHAGLAFCANKPTHRYDAGWTGYFVDWIDRLGDRGLRLSRFDANADVEIIRGVASITVPEQPPLVWRLEVEDDHIRLFGDDVQYFDVVDATYRGGLFGFWTWTGGQELAFDNLNVTGDPLSACFTSSPAIPFTGSPVSFDATCSQAVGTGISSYQWQFGDDTNGSGPTVQHTYATAGQYMVKLTVQAGVLGEATLERSISVQEPLDPFAECFDRPAGPVDGWTTIAGTWNITPEGDVETITGGEAFLYAGDPPRPLTPDFVAEVDWQLLGGTDPVVGRHAGINFFWNQTTDNRFAADSRGYQVFYIDRAGDRGLTLMRWNFGALTPLNPPGGTPGITEPPNKIRIEVSGPRIQVFADGVSAIDVMDTTYRDGYFALWAWNANTVRFDNVLIGATQLPTCEGLPPGDLFVRGDGNADGRINLTDPIFTLAYLFQGGPEPTCFDAADVDDSGGLQITDPINILSWLFQGGPPPRPPQPSMAAYATPGDCGEDPTPDRIDCATFSACGTTP